MSNKRGLGKIGIMLLCIIVIFIGFGRDASVAHKLNKEDKRLDDLIQWGQGIIETPLKVVVKWQGEWSNAGKISSQEAAQKLTQLFGGSNLQSVTNTEYESYRSITVVDGIRVNLNWQGISDDKSYMIITMETLRGVNLTEIQHLQDKIHTQLDLMNMAAEWNASVQGNVKGGQSITTTMKDVETTLQSHLKLKQVETYADAMTLSHSYVAPSLGFNLISGDHTIDLQIAVHHDELSGENRVTLGFPIITIEY